MDEQTLKIKIIGLQKSKKEIFSFNNQSIASIVKEIPILKEGYDCIVNEDLIDKSLWHSTSLYPDDKIIFLPNFGLSALIVAIAGWSAAAVASASFFSVIGLTLFVADVLTAIGVGLLIQALSPKPKGMGSIKPTPSESPSYSFNPQTTQAAGLIKPRLYGKYKSYGNIIAAYASVKPDDKTKLLMNALISHGTGPVKSVDDIHINKQPSANFPDISIEIRRGLLEQEPVSLFDKLRIQYRPMAVITHEGDIYEYTTPDDDFDEVEMILKIKNVKYLAGGGVGSNTISIMIEAKELPDGEYETVVEEDLVNSGVDVYRKSFLLAIMAIMLPEERNISLE